MHGAVVGRKGIVSLAILLGFGALAGGAWAQKAPDAGLRLTAPMDWQVMQRHTPRKGVIAFAGHCALDADRVEARVAGGPTWKGRPYQSDWTRATWDPDTKEFTARLTAPAGGWYAVEARAMKGDAVVGQRKVEHVGVGDIFVVAGQSNSANWGEERLTPKTGLVVNFTGSKWQPADDPQPGAGGGGGSFIPPFGDALAERFKIPVGVVTCGIGAISVRQWLPKGVTFPNPPTLTFDVTPLPDETWASNGAAFDMLVSRMKQLGPQGFRAVLWHQGESDANQPDPKLSLDGAEYRKYLEQIIRESRKEIGWEAPWFVAQVSYHVPDDEASAEIRAGQKALWDDKVALEGPDTDALKGEYREAGGQGVHFSGKGLREHGARWAEKVGDWLESGGK
jgi:hypothetical protein